MKTTIDEAGRKDPLSVSEAATSLLAAHPRSIIGRFVREKHIPFIFLGAMVLAILAMDTMMPLRDFWFHEATLTQLGTWPVWLSQWFLPGWPIVPPLPHVHLYGTPPVLQSWAELPMLLGALVAAFAVYFAALAFLPERITWRFLFRSTLVLGCVYLLIPIVTSPDLYSYIAYARMGVFHNLNPLTTLPTAIRDDPVYNYVLWVDQPSAYGPTWIIITSFMQWTLARFGLDGVLPMVIALRLLGLAMHLVAVRLVWSISGKLQQLRGHSSSYPSPARLRATLAFAWNPLLLFEACVNAHNDAALLVLLLLVIWLLAQSKLVLDTSRNADLRTPIAVACLFALATCLKINLIVLFPALLLYLWAQAPRERRIIQVTTATIACLLVISLSYAPFWQGGAIFNVFVVNPSAYRTINTVADLLAHLYNSIAVWFGFPLGLSQGSPAERILHDISMGTFAIIYLLMLWRTIRGGHGARGVHGGITARGDGKLRMSLYDLVYWMALIWLLYCAIGSPWFWPWYLVTFFGLYALLESCGDADDGNKADEICEAGESGSSKDEVIQSLPGAFLLRTPWTARLLSFSMLTLYCFITWGPAHTFVPGLPGFIWGYFSGIWAWILPLIGIVLLAKRKRLMEPLEQAKECQRS
jgi:hypothetical protein